MPRYHHGLGTDDLGNQRPCPSVDVERRFEQRRCEPRQRFAASGRETDTDMRVVPLLRSCSVRRAWPGVPQNTPGILVQHAEVCRP